MKVYSGLLLAGVALLKLALGGEASWTILVFIGVLIDLMYNGG